MSNYLKKYENDYNNNKISLSKLQTYRREYDRLSDEEKEKLDYPNGKPKEKPATIESENSKTTEEQILETLRSIDKNTHNTNAHLTFYTILIIIYIIYAIFLYVQFKSKTNSW